MNQIDPQIANLAEIPLFVIALRRNLEHFVNKTGYDPKLHYRYHEGQFDVKAIVSESFALPHVVLTVGEGETIRNGGTLGSTVSAGIFVITKKVPSVDRDVVALYFINELTRFLLRKEAWAYGQDLAAPPQRIPYSNEYSDELNKKRLSLWSMIFEPTISISLNRDVTRFPNFSQLAVESLGLSQVIDPSESP